MFLFTIFLEECSNLMLKKLGAFKYFSTQFVFSNDFGENVQNILNIPMLIFLKLTYCIKRESSAFLGVFP